MSGERIRWSTDPMTPRLRLRVAAPPRPDAGVADCLWTISEEIATSRTDSARVSEVVTALDLTPEEAQWLYGALGEMLGGAS